MGHMNAVVPGVGVGVIIENEKGEILIGKRINSHAPKYSIPGGKLDYGESFESAACREIKEETGLILSKPRVIGVTNNLETQREDGVHFISVILLANEFEGIPEIKEPNKCSELLWCDPSALPQPHFEASRLAVQCYLEDVVYCGISD
jgi:8-oxo-dGTP diphosphatase